MSTVIVDQGTPRWIREFARFAPLYSMVLVHGNVSDLVSFPVGSDRDRYWTQSDLAGFMLRFLPSLGYDVVAILDPIDGLAFAVGEMEEVYHGIASSGALPDGGQGPPAPRRAPPPPQDELSSALDGIRRALASAEVASAFVVTHASRLVTSPGALSRRETDVMVRILKAAHESKDVIRKGGQLRNLLVLVCDKLNDLPAYLYVGNPRARAIHLDRPDAADRTRFLQSRYRVFEGAVGDEPEAALCGRFSALTDGFANYELMSLVSLSRREHIAVTDIEALCERFKYGVRESPWDRIDRARLDDAQRLFGRRVLGQDHALAQVLDLVKRSRLGLAAGSWQSSQRPRGVLFFAGPTGVGKTETAKCLAELLFGHEDRLVRFDMTEYGAEHDDQKLMGAPPGYVGYEEGGQLTNQVKSKPFSVLLFDEIEKAHPSILDKFLQILDDGRLTDGQGETVYFNETLIVFTSNLGTVNPRAGSAPDAFLGPDRMSAEGTVSGPLLDASETPYEQMRATILERIRDHFNFRLRRPEILNRFGDNFVVFDFIRRPVAREIAKKMLGNLKEQLRRSRGISIEFDPSVLETVMELALKHLGHGGRGVRNVVDTAVVNPLARTLFDRGVGVGARLRMVRLDDRGDGEPYRYVPVIEDA